MFIHWKKSILLLKSTGTVCVLYPWFPDFAAHGLEKSCSWLVSVAMLGRWACSSYIPLHHSLCLQKASTKSFLFSFHFLPLIFSARARTEPVASLFVGAPLNSLCDWKWWWPASHSFVLLSDLVPHLGKVVFSIGHSGLWAWIFKCSSIEEVSGSWVWERAVAMLSDTLSASAFQNALLVAKAHALMDWGDLNLPLVSVLAKWKSST